MKKASLVAVLVTILGLVIFLFARKGSDNSSVELHQDKHDSKRMVQVQISEKSDTPINNQVQTSGQISNPDQSSALSLSQVEEEPNQPHVRKSKSSAQIRQNFLNILPEYGFTQHEIDTALDIIAAEFERSNEVNLIEAVEKTSKQLELNPERKEALNKAVLKSVFGTTITHQQVEACIQHRLKYESQCNKDIGQDMLQNIVSRLETNELDAKILSSLQDVQKNAVSKSVKDCNTAIDKAEVLFDLYLSNCP
ncbi:MAG TPA: hypothetical protein VE954_06575 [Oligoflexus sp.]|uniref:hypothetical protein n=1 Tax=Oligoflexus sp. TaxID=1971216 RepID=UPI002D3A5CEC|nr:hypothetical protein [Oligoflexus sp.]HYX32761.1 hypothetical protein [Oligoflexus sp.]